MPCLDISRMLRIRNGNLEALDACCNWVVVGSLAAADNEYQPPEHPQYDPDADPPQTWYECGKASAVMNVLSEMGAFIWDNYDVDPWEFETRMRGEYPQYSLSRFAMYEAWLQWNSIALIGYNKANSFSDTIRDLAICKLVDDLEATATITDAEYDHVLSSVNSAVSDLYPGSGLPPTRGDITAQWETVMDIIGQGDLKTVMLLGASNDAATCDCPEILEEPPSDLDWFHVYDFTVDEQTFVDPGATAAYVSGEGWYSEESGGNDINLQTNGAGKTNSTGSSKDCYVTFIRMTVARHDPWLSGYRECNVKMDASTPFQVEFEPADGARVLTWLGYGKFVVPNGSTPSIRMRIIADECGPTTGAYKALVSKLEVGGKGAYDPFVGGVE